MSTTPMKATRVLRPGLRTRSTSKGCCGSRGYVLPLVRKEQPTFTLDVIGQTFVRWKADDGIVLGGPVDELAPVYRTSAFATSAPSSPAPANR